MPTVERSGCTSMCTSTATSRRSPPYWYTYSYTQISPFLTFNFPSCTPHRPATPSPLLSRALACICLVALLTSCRLEPAAAPAAGEIRLVSLAPSLTEIIAAIGADDKLIGRSSACNHPPDIVDTIPIVGGFGVTSVEALLAAAPTLVVSTDLEDKSLVEQLAVHGIELRTIRCERLTEIPAAIRELGRLTGRAEAADALADRIASGIAQRRADPATTAVRPSVYLEIWHDPPMTAGRDSYLNDLIELAGGRNIADDVDKAYFRPSSEWVVQRDPAVIVSMSMSGKASTDRLAARPGWRAIDAARHGRVHHGLNADIVLRPGPRVLEAIDLIAACLQP